MMRRLPLIATAVLALGALSGAAAVREAPVDKTVPQSQCRPCERRDPYRGIYRLSRLGNAVRKTMACGYGPLLSQGRRLNFSPLSANRA